ncbi:MAG: hypothetical protein IPP13_03665 [Kouleothrix sp.]|jgi:hypothetical protein|nr:hypothetical protein [Kouleothrix sp.]
MHFSATALRPAASCRQLEPKLGTSPYNHDDGPEGPQEADEDAAAASISAAQCYLSGEVQPADEAGSRAIEAAFRIADDDLQLDPNDFVWDPNAQPMPLAREAMHPAVQSAL